MAFGKKQEEGQASLHLPVHIGIIMDGNGRWAQKRFLPRSAGHRAGAQNFRTITRYCSKIGIRYLTVYAFSTENWNRPSDEVGALLRRSSITPTDSMNAGKITIIPTSHKVFVDGQEINLTHKEYELLHFFMVNPSQIFSREQLLNRIWGYDFEGTTRTVDTHIKTLRQKLGDEGKHIVTLIRSGYKFEVSV